MTPQLTNKKVQFKTFFDNDLPKEMDNDVDRLKRILLNLLLNAQKFT